VADAGSASEGKGDVGGLPVVLLANVLDSEILTDETSLLIS
jgi:hypothetical protein